MKKDLNVDTVFGFIKPEVDVHILGMSTIANILRDCGFKVIFAPADVMKAVENISKLNNAGLVNKWISDNHINVISFSYRLDPQEGCNYFCSFYHQISESKLLAKDGGSICKVSFAGLPDTCHLIKNQLGDQIIYFPGDETPIESLEKFGVPPQLYPKAFTFIHDYDRSLLDFAEKFIESEKYNNIGIPDHYGYPDCGTPKDSFLKRLDYCLKKQSLPMIRVHAGPYSPNRIEAIKEYQSWARQLARTRLLDVLSIGSSQLTQQHFGEDWEGLKNGGGVPVNSEIEYREIAQAAKPMLVRTYAGTNNVPWMAQMHERTLNISWHALSFWWFCQLDGRGDNTVLDNLKEHIETIKYIASTGKPLEPNVPHHFSFRGGDDVTYIVSAFLAAKTAKKYGIKHLILQNMLNTPKYTWGVEDIAKGRAMLRLVRKLEDNTFKVSLQTRAGLDYFSPDLEKAKVQLAAITAMMDDIEPENPNSPEIIHVVSYSEAVRLATPPIIEESIKITLGALKEYRLRKSLNLTVNTIENKDINERYCHLYEEASEAIDFLEKNIPDLYTPQGLFRVYEMGFLPTPYIYDPDKKFPEATKWHTAIVNGEVKVVDENGKTINTLKRYKSILGL
ncbi:MAG: cobalamin-binding protein [Bacteroidales bacterium]|nr:cobalamin-binding protein [Bacteroidales bacterium]